MGILDFLRPRKMDAAEIADVARDDWAPPPMAANSMTTSWGDWLEEPDVELEEIEQPSIDPELAELAKRARRPVTGPLPRAEALAALASSAKPPPTPPGVALPGASPPKPVTVKPLTGPVAIVAQPAAVAAKAAEAKAAEAKPAESESDVPAYLMHLTPEEREIIRAQQASEAQARTARAPRRHTGSRLRSTLGLRKGRPAAAAPIVAASSFREHLTEEELAIIASQQRK